MTRPNDSVCSLFYAFVLGLSVCGCSSLHETSSMRDLLSPENRGKWRLARVYEGRPDWVLTNGVYSGADSLVAYPQQFTNFVLECDFLFQGKADGGIQLRSVAAAAKPWEVGYELDIDWAPDMKHGHIHFPVKPKPYRGEALFSVSEWHTVRVQADGPRVVVHLDGQKALEFEDAECPSGQFCLQGEKDGVLYRNIRVKELK